MFVKGMKRHPNAGRKPGAAKKFKINLEELFLEYKFNPAHEILKNLEDLEPKDRVNVCLKLMEFCVPKLRSIEHSGEVTTNAPVVQILLPSNGREVNVIDVSSTNEEVADQVAHLPKPNQDNSQSD